MYAAYDVVDERAEGLCEAKVTPFCIGYGTEHQHLYKRLVRPDQVAEPDAIILICGPCHRWVEHDPIRAVELGAARFGWMDDPGPKKIYRPGEHDG